MKKFALLLLVVSIGCSKPSKKIEPAAESKPISDECVLLATVDDPSTNDDYPLQLCMYTHRETRGIYSAIACVTVLVEGQTGTRHPFYGSKGHWGIEGACDTKKITDKLKEPQTMKTVNPISDLKLKRKAGKSVEIVKDELNVASTLIEVTTP